MSNPSKRSRNKPSVPCGTIDVRALLEFAWVK